MTSQEAMTEALDALAASLTYDGHDQHILEARHFVEVDESQAKSRMESMRRRQALHDGDRSDEQLRRLDACAEGLEYPGWREDVQRAEAHHVSTPSLFDGLLMVMQAKDRRSRRKRAQREEVNDHWTERRANSADALDNEGAAGSSKTEAEQLASTAEHDTDSSEVSTSAKRSKPAPGSEEMCAICMEHPRDHIFVPCGHLCICQHCVARLKARPCPVCRKQPDTIIRVFK